MSSHTDDPCVDEDGTRLVDDITIADEAVLWRRVAPNWLHHESLSSGEINTRPGKVAFIDRLTYRLSAYVAEESNINQVLNERPGDSLAEVRAGWFRQYGYAIVRKPTTAQPSHVVICPTPETKPAKAIAKQAHLIVQKRCEKADCLTCEHIPPEGMRRNSRL